jgi:small neutral amino acid transporter SnatA (MarC family)
MNESFRSLVSFLAILNPLALCLYLLNTMEELDWRSLLRVLSAACLLSWVVFGLCALGGEYVLVNILNVRTEAMRVFGGLIFLLVGYSYATKGYRETVALRGSLEELPAAIALPFMIGAGTITQSILIGKQHSHVAAITILLIGVALALIVVLAFKLFRDRMRGAHERIFDRYVNIGARVNGLVIGSISVEMIINGVFALWRDAQAA